MFIKTGCGGDVGGVCIRRGVVGVFVETVYNSANSTTHDTRTLTTAHFCKHRPIVSGTIRLRNSVRVAPAAGDAQGTGDE